MTKAWRRLIRAGAKASARIRADIRPPHVPGQRGANVEVPRRFPRASNIAVGIDCGPMAPVPLDGGTATA